MFEWVWDRKRHVHAERDHGGSRPGVRPAKPALQLDLPPIVRALLVGATISALPACVPPYRPPTASEPHALVKVRRSYESVKGMQLREVVDVAEHRALAQGTETALLTGARIDSLLVHPVRARLRIASAFFHTEVRRVHESYYDRTSHLETEHYDCGSGYGIHKTYRTCTRLVTRYKSELKYRWVTKAVEVSDGSCETALRFAPAEGHVYLVQYTYRDNTSCSASCMEQTPVGDGTFRNSPCP
jgi:hypothetical protein